MTEKDAIVLNYLRNRSDVKGLNSWDLREYLIDHIPTSGVSGIWFALVMESINTINYPAIHEFINNADKYNAIREEQLNG